MGVQLLDKTRKINKLLHNNHSHKVVFNDICEVLSEILESNILVISRKGKVLGVANHAGIDEIHELIEDQENNNKTSKVIITVIIVIALGMTAIGMISNQLIGFEGRKKECAVMLSTAMGRGKLSSVLLLEAFITAFTASGVGTIIGTFLTTVFKAASADSAIPVMTLEIDPLKNIIFFVLLTLVFTGTVLFPIKNLKKMKISEQIKYE